MLLVSDRMTAPAVTSSIDDAIDDVVRIFQRESISATPVLLGERLAGVVSTTDIVHFLSNEAGGAGTVGSIMTAPALTAQPGEPLEDAAWRLARARFHRLVVTNGDRPVGVLSACDVLEAVRERRIQAAIGTLMTAPVETIDIGDSIDTATQKLATTNVHGIVVVDGESPVGVYTHREAIAARRLPPTLRLRPVEDVMSQETICLDVDTPAYRAAGYGISMNVRRLLVVQGRHLVGIVSAIDLVGALAPAHGLSGSATLGSRLARV
jgi:CBS domain-containing protein